MLRLATQARNVVAAVQAIVDKMALFYPSKKPWNPNAAQKAQKAASSFFEDMGEVDHHLSRY